MTRSIATDAPSANIETTDDLFLGDRLAILQPRSGYRAGLDAVLLAAVCPASPESPRVLDAGSGVGVVGLAVAARLPSAYVTLVERQPELARLAIANAQRNCLSERVTVLAGDLTTPDLVSAASATLADGSYDHVLANPPYQTEGDGHPARDTLKAAAHAMAAGDLDRWARFLARMTRPGGTCTLIHRADALGAVLGVLDGRFGGLTVLPIHARAGEAAIRVLVQGRKGSRAPLSLRDRLVLHEADGTFRHEINAILRAPGPLPDGVWR